MQKIYGYKLEDVEGLALAIKNSSTKNLTELFSEYAVSVGKAKGTVRNLYYALVKLCETDQDFCNKYFNGKPPVAQKPQSFTKAQEDWLLKEVTEQKNKGRSVRSIINQLAGGDLKLALRYQNKYRSLLVKHPQKAQAYHALSIEQPSVSIEPTIPEVQLVRLKREINGLVSRISQKIRQENQHLKSRIAYLQAENLRLNNLLYGQTRTESLDFFRTPPTENAIQ